MQSSIYFEPFQCPIEALSEHGGPRFQRQEPEPEDFPLKVPEVPEVPETGEHFKLGILSDDFYGCLQGTWEIFGKSTCVRW